MRTARRISQVFFLLSFLWLVWRTTYPYDSLIPADLFLRASALVAVTTILTSRSLVPQVLLGLLVLALTVPLGRAFCGWVCPLGTTLEVVRKVSSSKRKAPRKTPSTRWRWGKFAILVGILVSAVLGTQLLWPFDPVVLLTRTASVALYPLFTAAVSGLLGLVARVPFLEGAAYRGYALLYSAWFPLKQPPFHLVELFFVLLVLILALEKASRRFWCRNLCPLGALLGFFSQFRVLHREVDENCSACGLCKARCRMNAVEDDYVTTSAVECIACGECVSVCAPRATHYALRKPVRSGTVDLDRRRFIGATVAGVATVGLLGVGFVDRGRRASVIRPPGALPEADFLDRCIRCQECVKVCSSTGGCLQPSLWESGLVGLWTPVARPREGYCEYNCNLCGQVCPTGAIHRLPLEVKQLTKIGLAFFDKSRCIPWYRGEDCLVCEEHCPVPDKAIRFDEHTVRRPDGSEALVKLPYVVEELCIGCGICVTKCPVVGQGGIFLTSANEQRWPGSESLSQ
ncbi:MAG: 4Fe-4S binding protein [bacterium]|jgi:polyferredoxin/Fe-S-cluster-containing dehydrogenase component|nr:4Fe-4S binding protein [candidate division KSB1 bacterium]MDH7558673.1 4Fe-4S binding protein [bacterium]